MPDASPPSHGCATINVLLVDAHAVTRVGVRTVLTGTAERDIAVVGECATADEALALAASLSPRVAVVDLLTDAAGGFGLIKDLRLQTPGIRTLVYTDA